MSRFSILILTHNRLIEVERCFNSLRSTLSRKDVECFVLDNASTDGTAQYIAGLGGGLHHTLLSYENMGVAGGRAKLLNSVSPDSQYVIFLDSDTEIIDPQWLDKFAAFFDEHEAVGLAGPGGSMVKKDWSGFIAGSPNAEADCIAGYCQCFRRELLTKGLKINVTDYPNFWTEDSDFCLQIRDLGWDIFCLPVGVQHFPAHSGYGQDMTLHDQHIAVFREQWRGKGLVKAEGAY